MTFLRPTLLTLACLLASPGFADDLPSLGDASSAIVSPQQEYQPVSYTHLTLPTTPYV